MLHYHPTVSVCCRLCPVRLLLHLRPFRRPTLHPHPLHIYLVLIPPPAVDPWTRCPFHCYTQVHNGPGRNKLCDCVLAAGYEGLHLLQHCLCRHVLHQGVCPQSVFLLPRLLSCQTGNLPNTLLMHVVITHVSDLYIITDWTNANYIWPKVQACTSSPSITIFIHTQL